MWITWNYESWEPNHNIITVSGWGSYLYILGLFTECKYSWSQKFQLFFFLYCFVFIFCLFIYLFFFFGGAGCGDVCLIFLIFSLLCKQLMTDPSLRIKKKMGKPPSHDNARTMYANYCLRINVAIRLLMFDQQILPDHRHSMACNSITSEVVWVKFWIGC